MPHRKPARAAKAKVISQKGRPRRGPSKPVKPRLTAIISSHPRGRVRSTKTVRIKKGKK